MNRYYKLIDNEVIGCDDLDEWGRWMQDADQHTPELEVYREHST